MALGAMAVLTLAAPALGQEPNVDKAIDTATQATTKAANQFADLLKSDPWQWGHLIAAGVALTILLFADVIRPGSLERAGKRSVEPHSSMIWLLCAFLVLGMQIVGSGFVPLLPAEWLGGDSLQRSAISQGVQYAAAIITAFVLCRLITGGSKGAGLSFSFRSLAWGALAALAAWPIVIAASIGFVALHVQLGNEPPTTNLGHPTLQLIVEHRNNPWAWAIAGLAIIAAPIVEEVVYRGFVQSAFLKATGKPWTSIILASMVFAGVHLLPWTAAGPAIPWYSVATIGVLGIAMGVAFERTKEVGVPITMHVLFNLTNVLIALWGTRGS